MVATLAQAASAAYYLEGQRSFRHPNEYYTAGEEPDGVWFNPHALFGLTTAARSTAVTFTGCTTASHRTPEASSHKTRAASGARRVST